MNYLLFQLGQSSRAIEDLERFECLDIAKLLISDVTKLLSSGISPLTLVAKEISEGRACKSSTRSK